MSFITAQLAAQQNINTTPVAVPFVVQMNVIGFPPPGPNEIQIKMRVQPSIPVFVPLNEVLNTNLTIIPIPLRIRDSVFGSLHQLLSGRVDSFFDETRAGHTLLNFGEDYQALVTKWQYDPADSTGATLLVKLYEPLPDDVDEKTQLWITRELAPPVIDRLYAKFTPPPPPKVYLRPPNTNITLNGRGGATVANQTLTTLLSTGSFDPVRPTDPVTEQWYTDDINSAELNIDYSDYRNFVFFGSAAGRLQAFVNKLLLLESFDTLINFHSSSLASSGSMFITGSSTYASIQGIQDQRIDLVRSFDPYERFLYYKTEVPYSSSINTDDPQDEFLFASDATWPKISGSIAAVASASAWLAGQLVLAAEYDQQNQNYLGNNIPQYIKSDATSAEFLTFLDMIGHQLDTLKTYIDQMPNMFDRDSNPITGLSQDLVWNIAESFGIDLPNGYAVNKLVDYTLGHTGTAKIYRQAASETWKRFLHNQIFMMKAKGTKASLRALANAYGILPTVLQIRESTTPGVANTSGTFEQFEEQTNVLSIPSGSYVQIPWALSSALSSSTMEVRFSTTDNSQNTVLLNADNVWAMRLEPISGSYGRVTLTTGSIASVSSSALPIYSGDFYSVMVRASGSGAELVVKRADQGDIIESSDTVEAHPVVLNSWYTASNVNLGASGSFFGKPFTGMVDEFRMWGEVLTDATFNLHVQYPGLYNGNTTTSVRDSLYVRLSFNKPKSLGTAASVTLNNEAPSFKTQTLNAKNFPLISSFPYNMTVIERDVMRFSPNAGGSQFTTNKIIIADPPVLTYISGSNVPVLSRDKSIVSLADKKKRGQSTNTIGFYFSLTDAINDNIIRTFGNVDLQSLIGDPADQYSGSYKSLDALNDLYWTSYAYSYNVNSFVDFVRNLLEPLFKQAKQLIPARAKLLSGIVHEPHILERSKQIIVSPVEVTAGTLTKRHQTDTYNLEADPVTSQPDQIETAWEDMDVVFDTTQEYVTNADRLDYEGVLVAQSSSMGIHSDYLVFDDYTNLIAYKAGLLQAYGVIDPSQLSAFQQGQFGEAVQNFRSSLAININGDYISPAKTSLGSDQQMLFQEILPITDFTKYEAFTYFQDPNGLFAVPKIVQVRQQQNILVDRGTWAAGTIYNRNDFVAQSGSVSGSDGNGNEFVCVSPQQTFTSNVPPFLDTTNWRAMTYTPVMVEDIKMAAVISGSVSLVPTGSTFPVAVGYQPTHYKFTRDKRRGIIRHQYLGCIFATGSNGSWDTFDGKSPVEVFYTTGNELVVQNPGSPIQPTNNPTGPILDVK